MMPIQPQGEVRYSVATFYKFVDLPDCAALRSQLLAYGQSRGIRGTILLAREGINGTIAASLADLEVMLAYVRSDPRFADLTPRVSTVTNTPFGRFKVKFKPEIVTLGIPEINPSQQRGIYVNPQTWNQLLEDPEVKVIDTRNQYEVAIGTFDRAIDPQIRFFRQFPDYVRHNLDPEQHRKIAMFCTGGIRCEKASAFLRSQGFHQVYHLQGGILRYLAEVPPQDSRWHGECFVFDERVSVQQGLKPGHYQLCPHCGHPILDTCEACRDASSPALPEPNDPDLTPTPVP